jgi:hypothetical protein
MLYSEDDDDESMKKGFSVSKETVIRESLVCVARAFFCLTATRN